MTEIKINKSTLYTVGVLALLLFGGYFTLVGGSKETSMKSITSEVGEVQIVKLSVSGGNYVLSPSTLRKGDYVRLEADSSVSGCARSIVIPAFNIRKVVGGNDNTIEFLLDKAGTFNIACSMNMYRGTFEVLESDGGESDYVEPELASGGSCSMGKGCGCGG